jgi:hypothetical protein
LERSGDHCRVAPKQGVDEDARQQDVIRGIPWPEVSVGFLKMTFSCLAFIKDKHPGLKLDDRSAPLVPVIKLSTSRPVSLATTTGNNNSTF